MPVIAYRSFNAGEVSKRLAARSDQEKYQSGARTMRNFLPTVEGASQNRAGQGYVRPCHDFTAEHPPRLIPFVVSDSESYVLVLEHLTLSVITYASPQFDAPVAISGITKANPAVVTTGAPHNLTTGQLVWIDGAVGMTQVNRRFFRAVVLSGTTFELEEEAGTNVNSTGYGTWTAGGTVNCVHRIDSPWSGADLRQIRKVQSGSVMYLAHINYHVHRLDLTAGPTWSLGELVDFLPSISGPLNGSATGDPAGSENVRYQVTAVAEDSLEESLIGQEARRLIDTVSGTLSNPILVTTLANHGYVTGDRVTCMDLGVSFDPDYVDVSGIEYPITVTGLKTFTLDGTVGIGTFSLGGGGSAYAVRPYIQASSITFPTSTDPVTVTWDPVSGALEYLVYREINGIFAYVGTSATTSFVDKGFDLYPSDTPPINFRVFYEIGDTPKAIGMAQQRLMAGGSVNDRQGVRISRTALFENFTKSNPIQADDAFRFVIASDKAQEVRHFVEMSRPLVFCDGTIWTLEGDEAGAITPGSVYPRKRAEHGVGDIAPIPIGNAVIYVQVTGRVVNEIIPGGVDDFPSKNLTVYSRHLFDRNAIVSWSYAEDPTSIVWAARDDGSFLAMTYVREHDVWGWSRHDTGAGDEVVDCCSVPEGEETATYFVVRRYGVGAGPRYYIERMATRQVAHAADGLFLDSYRHIEQVNEDPADLYELRFNADHTDEPAWSLAIGGGTPAWVTGEDSSDHGRVILLYGPDGERLWCTVTEVINTNNALVDVRTDLPGVLDEDGAPNADDVAEEDGVPFPIALPYSTESWSQSIDEVTDAWHLEGREVYAVVDGIPQGPFTVAGGSFALGDPGVLVTYGLQIVADLETLEPDNPDGQTWAGRTKTVGQVVVRVEETDGLQVGLSTSSLQPWDDGWCEEDQRRDGFLYTGSLRVHNQARTSRTGTVLLRQSSGLPTTVLGIYPDIEIGDA